MKKQAVDFFRERFTFSGEVSIETDYLWADEQRDYYFDVAVVDEIGLPIIVVEVGRCDQEKVQALVRYEFLEIYHWPCGQQKPSRVVRPWDPQWDPEHLQFEPVV